MKKTKPQRYLWNGKRKVYMSDGLPWPLTVTRSRYGGTYEHGSWIAGNVGLFPDDAFGDDMVCLDFWEKVRENDGVYRDGEYALVFGVGESAQDAIDACLAACERYNDALEAEVAA